VYYVLSPDYAVFMDIQQAINLTLFRRLREEGMGFAFPTRTLHVEGRLDAPQIAPPLAPDVDRRAAGDAAV
jgi:small-conductance mechanosensitive channel